MRPVHPFGQPPTQVVVPSLAEEALDLAGEEADHLRKSLRLVRGATCVATDGEGTVARLRLDAVGRGGIEATVLERRAVAPPALRLWLAAGAEGARGDWIVEKAVELGAWGFLPLGEPEPRRIARWGRLARAALKQSLGAWSLRLRSEDPLALARQGAFAGLWLGAPEGADPLREGLPAQGDWLLVSGPPEGLGPAREEAFRAVPGARVVSLGPRRLRAETAALGLLVAAVLAARPTWETG